MWQDLQDSIIRWKEDKDTSLEGSLKHLLEEVEDLSKNPYDPLSIADCFILLIGICDEVGYSMDEVAVAIESKMAVNFSRIWEKDEDGVVRHIQETKV